MNRTRRPSYHLTTVFGKPLSTGVRYVGFCTTIIAGVNFFDSVLTLSLIQWHGKSSKTIVQGSTIMAALVTCPLSLYQLLISSLLIHQSRKRNGDIFLCSVWFSSHVTILLIYAIFLGLKSAALLYYKKYVSGILNLFVILVYEALFIYFEVIVNSYIYYLTYCIRTSQITEIVDEPITRI